MSASEWTLSPRDAAVLMKRWSWTYETTKGGHAVYRWLDGRRVQLPAPGRPAKTRSGVGVGLREASKIMGLPMQTFLKGPEAVDTQTVVNATLESSLAYDIDRNMKAKEEPVGAPVFSTDHAKAVIEQQKKTVEEPPNEELKRGDVGRLTRACVARTDDPVITIPDVTTWIREQLGFKRELTISEQRNVGLALERLVEDGILTKLRRGRWARTPTQNGAGPVPEASVVPPTPEPERAPAPTRIVEGTVLWEQKADLGDSRLLLVREDGQLFVAKLQKLEI